MTLNAFRDEPSKFLRMVDPEGLKSGADILNMLDEEFCELKRSVSRPDRFRHQVYDMLFLLFELAAKFNFDLDLEWNAGRDRKQKYHATTYPVEKQVYRQSLGILMLPGRIMRG
jgi:hypothetical protein